jgi:hypothetical protein
LAVRLVQIAGALEPGPVTTPLAAATLGLQTLACYKASRPSSRSWTSSRPAHRHGGALVGGVVWDRSGLAWALLAAGANPDRLRSSAAFALLHGASGIQASLGRPVGIG